ncbi:tetratricopeptide repeat protein [Sphingomonas bacterium]|uniref:tetratricopeptide repeat protein n=1 Tax=Sphingomonas bacterium TaxID=1895847 RepID=UPI0015757565|nr:hypothetical protein [Sphingomonas bacterium]
MGYLALALLAAAAFAATARFGVARPLWSMVGAALMAGATGYAWQGRPGLPGADPRPEATVRAPEPALIELRDRMFGGYTLDHAYLNAADVMQRVGEPRLAVLAILGGLRKMPESLSLWTGLGTALAAHDGDRVSPPALFAFEHARHLAPDQPAPLFFEGLAYIHAGDFAAARPLWARALALTPPGVSYHRDIAERLTLLDQYLAALARTPRAAD